MMRMIFRLLFSLVCLHSAYGVLPEELDCTNDGGPASVDADLLRSMSLGSLSGGGFTVTVDGNVVTPESQITATLGQNVDITLSRSGFQGYLFRVARQGAGNPFSLIRLDAVDVGAASFCSALGLLNTTGIDVAPAVPFTFAGLEVFLDGSSDVQISVDVIGTSSTAEYDYFYDRFLINMVKASEKPSSSPSKQPTLAPQQPSQEPSSTPSLTISQQPSIARSSSPTSQPSSGPSSRPSSGPTNIPSLAPSSTPSQMPTTNPSTSFPSSAPSRSPVQAPVQQPVTNVSPSTQEPTAPEPSQSPSFTPSATPTSSPVSTTDVIATFQNFQLTFPGVETLDAEAQADFVDATQDWYNALYASRRRSLARFLQAQGISQFSTSLVFRSQSISESGNTLTYDQTVSYQEEDNALSINTQLDVVLSPFDNDALVGEYRSILADYNEAFRNIPSSSTIVPDDSSVVQLDEAPSPSPSDSSGNDFTLVLILAGVAGALAIALLAFYICRSKKQQKTTSTKSVAGHDHEEASNPPPSVARGAAKTQVVMEGDEISAMYEASMDGFSLDLEQQSLSTIDYDYSKVANGTGNRSIVSSSGGTLGDNTRQDSVNQSKLNLDRLGISFASESKDDEAEDDSKVYSLVAPAGKLGVVVDTPDDGPPVIHAIKDTSVLFGKIQVGDRMLKVDEEDVSGLSAVKISRLISSRSGQERTFTLRASRR